ncbi:Putative AMP-dependent synthetase/ligase, AMP-binding enzyme domain, ANL domain-containing protein [Septoria linicola]|uniref:AMP-dependent synthetase/ligase, AMP-binding enzyme domain, ANL domain-containing protein n=1 Tax=Septoria linicola TaxID=215465 RepID=A0A9Q9AU69_9PEZI|nr:Putative AMP-dependent synthetase/ligase, AMP-binding enzyme domain, ANL domain-containing protein [Septoria linicola]
MDWTTATLSRVPDDQDAPILIDTDRPERTISWRQYNAAVRGIAAGLQAEGLQSQDCVALLCENDVYYHTLGHGVIAAGGIFCPMQTSEKPAEITHQLKAASVKWMFSSPRLFDLALQSAKAAGLPESQVVLYDPPGVDAGSNVQSRLSRMLPADVSSWRNPNIDKDPKSIMALRMFSSGTTGVPKAANISHAALLSQLHQPGFYLEKSSANSTRAFVCIPLYHATSLMAYNNAVAGPQTTCITAEKGTGDVPRLFDLIREFKITATLLPPRFLMPFANCKREGTRPAEDVVNLETVRIGGSAINADHIKVFRDTFPRCNLLVGYGTTEVGTIAIITDANDFVPGRVGHIMPDAQVKFIDPTTLEEVPHGEVGEICVRGPQIFSGYHDNPEGNASSLLPDSAGDWFRTGDKGYFDDASSQIAITGRYKEIFKVASKEVSPDEVENVLMQLPAIEDAAVTPVPARHDENELEVRAYVVPKDKSAPIAAEDVAIFVAEKLSRHKVPTGGVIFCDQIPRNAMKKVVRRKLNELVALKGSREWLCVEH